MQYYSPLRYPGGKGRLATLIKDIIEINQLNDGTYVEPYAGGAGVALALLLEEYVWDIVINDIDPAIYAFWHTVLDKTEWFKKQIRDTPVTIEQWDRQKEIFMHQNKYSLNKVGFAAFYLNRTNRSGILQGGVIGGRKQSNFYKINARFNKESLTKRIDLIARHKSRIRVYNKDATDLVQHIAPKIDKNNTLFYFDPPYYSKGNLLYTNHYTQSDHYYVSKCIKSLTSSWLVTYDDNQAIRDLYAGLPCLPFSMTYSANQERCKGSEIMFYQGLRLPEYINKMKAPYFSRHNVRDLSIEQ
ncbi:DNA adenine methylase [Desulfonatronovibrio hydrogenovorans]|uniref:DNA adenine methylase n=1 Tax=Desulfonatronovibrio hydrogenovorans TaxID=53245 RepID=UPI00048C766F|nr:DNA adenine methylase [Desulfonatronovibrio hydrogenovorans]